MKRYLIAFLCILFQPALLKPALAVGQSLPAFTLYQAFTTLQTEPSCVMHTIINTVLVAKALIGSAAADHLALMNEFEFSTSRSIYQFFYKKFRNSSYGSFFRGYLSAFARKHFPERSIVNNSKLENLFMYGDFVEVGDYRAHGLEIRWPSRIITALRSGKTVLCPWSESVDPEAGHATLKCIIPQMRCGLLVHLHIIDINSGFETSWSGLSQKAESLSQACGLMGFAEKRSLSYSPRSRGACSSRKRKR